MKGLCKNQVQVTKYHSLVEQPFFFSVTAKPIRCFCDFCCCCVCVCVGKLVLLLLLLFFCLFKIGLDRYPRMALNSQRSSCFRLLACCDYKCVPPHGACKVPLDPVPLGLSVGTVLVASLEVERNPTLLLYSSSP